MRLFRNGKIYEVSFANWRRDMLEEIVKEKNKARVYFSCNHSF